MDPLQLPANVLDANPNFADLVGDIFKNHLTKDGCTQQTSAALEHERSVLHRERTGYLEVQLLYNAVKDFIYTHEAEKENLAVSSSGAIAADEMLFDRVSELLDVFEAAQALDMTSSCIEQGRLSAGSQTTAGKLLQTSNDYQLLGCSEDLLLQTLSLAPDQMSKVIRSVQQQLIPRIEAGLSKTVQQLTSFFPEDTLENAGDISDTVAQTIGRVKQSSRELIEAKKQSLLQFDTFVQAAQDLLEVLTDIVEKYKLTHQSSYDSSMKKWMKLKCSTLAAKMEVLKYRFLVKTYTPSTVKALRKTKALLETEFHQAQHAYTQSLEKLQQYDRVGAGFEELVAEYAHLMNRIEQSQWNLQQMN